MDEQPELTVEVRKVQPYQARKVYLCPGCNQEIGVGVSHLVVVPEAEPDLRRHWHAACWEFRVNRRPRDRRRRPGSRSA